MGKVTRGRGMSKISILTIGFTLVWAAPVMAQAPPLDTYGGAGGVLGDIQEGDVPGEGGVQGDVVSGQPDQGGVLGEIQTGDEAGVRGEVQDDAVAGETARGTTPGASGTLPFTGLDLGLMALGAMLLLGIGVGVRRVSRSLA